jgi:D-alanine-D-alanine ligase
MTKIRVGVLFGGQNPEHEISCASTAGVLSALDRERYKPVPIRIAEDGTWRVARTDAVPRDLDATGLIALTSDEGEGGTRAETMALALAALGAVDVVFPVFHGMFGEDGTVAALLDLLGVPYVGCGALTGAIAMDKEFTKTVLRADDLPVADGVVLRDPVETLSELGRKRFGLPVFVKPNSGGSSIGVTRVEDWADFDAAVAGAFRMDTKVLVEPAVPGREIGMSVLEFPDGRIEVGPPAETLWEAGPYQFASFEAKYRDSSMEKRVPADLDPDLTKTLSEMAVRAFRVLGCAGLIRADFFVHEQGEASSIVLNEVNTLPGLTETSWFPTSWASAGLAYPRLLDVLVDTALARGVRNRAAA